MIPRRKIIGPTYLLVYAIPMLFVFIAIPKALTFSKIIQAWTVGRMSTHMKNSILVAIPLIFLILLLTSIAGCPFGSLRWKDCNCLFAFILVGMMISIQVMGIPPIGMAVDFPVHVVVKQLSTSKENTQWTKWSPSARFR